MPTDSVQNQRAEQYGIRGTDAASVVRSIERGVVTGGLRPNDTVPSVRALARELGVSPTTVAAAYRDLRHRGVLVSHDRSRTVVAHRPPLAVRLGPEIPDGTVDLASGNPDPALLPKLGPPLARLDPAHRRYGDDVNAAPLIELAREDLGRDGVPFDHLAVVGGGLDGIERVLEVHCRTGDRIAVEDPGYMATFDLIRTLGLHPVPVAIDGAGMRPDALAAALDDGISTVLLVPRAQNPTGAALTERRAGELGDLLAAYPETLVIEDDHAAWVSGAPYHRTHGGRPRWAVVRSLAKSLGPDLRVAILAGDDDTVTRVTGRQRLGTGWVSHLLQSLAAGVWREASDADTLDVATATYAARRTALLTALRRHGIDAQGATGLNIWVPVPEEVPVVQGLASRGWAVQPGEPFRIDAPPAIRITTALLAEDQASALADDLAEILEPRPATRQG